MGKKRGGGGGGGGGGGRGADNSCQLLFLYGVRGMFLGISIVPLKLIDIPRNL